MKTTRTLRDDGRPESRRGASPREPEPVAPPGYELIRCLGRGGCGVVYLARDRTLDRAVALKFLSDAGPADVERFRREARFTARLRNPAIVPVFELGESGGRPYIAMQYVDGGNLAAADLDHSGLLRAIREVATALRCAHAEGIVHRDIKPENILLDRDGRAYLTDFGLARSLGGALGDTISRQGQIMGTPALMPPEQARGDLEAIDARSDIYGLGATLFVQLTGTYPFTGTHLVDVLHAVIHDPAPLPRARRSDIPRSLEAIIVRCMRKRREERYQSIDALVADVDRLLAGGHLEGGAWFRRLVADREPGVSAEPPPVSTPDPFLTQGLEVVRRLAAWDADLYRVSGSLAPSFERLDRIRSELDGILAQRPDAAWARFYRGVVHFRAGRLDEALEDMERSIDRVRNLAGAYFELGRLSLALYLRDQRLARQHLSIVGVESGLSSARSRLEQAALLLGEAERLDGELPTWHAEYARAVERLAAGDFDECVAACDGIVAVEPDVEQVWKLRGDARRLAGRDPFDSYDRALGIRRSDYETLHARAEAHLARGDLQAARDDLRAAHRIHPGYAPAVTLLARVELRAADGEGGLEALHRAADAARAALA
ncbi:MAG: protein kinase domain-containing protein, partial [Planctomycetota bacterium]